MKPTAIAPTIDEIAEAIREGFLYASKPVTDALAEFVQMKHIEQFNFGKLTFAAIGEAAKEAIPFIEYGAFQLPYAMVYYRTQLMFRDVDGTDLPNGSVVGAGYLVMPCREDENYGDGIHVISLCKSEGKLTAVHCVNKLKVHKASMLEIAKYNLAKDEVKCECVVRTSEIDFWKKTVPGNSNNLELHDGAFFTDSAQHVMGLTMIVNTRGVAKDRVEPPRKPNKARALQGRPMIPYVTRVSTALYMAAERAEGGGTHASPRPHRRRAHIRTYKNDDGSIKQIKPIAAMLVNWDGGPLLKREAYNISTD